MKKIIAAMITVAMLLSCIIAIPVSAVEGVVYTLDAKLNGDKVDVTVTLSDNDEGLASTCFVLYYNKNAVAPDMDSYEECGKVSEGFAWDNKKCSTDVSELDDGIFVLHYDKNANNMTNNGVVITITFDIISRDETFDFNYDVMSGNAKNNANATGEAVPFTFEIAEGSATKWVCDHEANAEAPTCTEAVVCTKCGETLVEALGHTEEVDAAILPTCYQTGLTEGKHCSVCGETLVPQEVVEATGEHVWAEEFTVDKAAGAGVAGEKSRHCTTEGCTERTDVTVIPALRTVTVDGVATVVEVGTVITLEAEWFADGKVFEYWDVASGNVALDADKESLANSIVMPDEDVVINSVKHLVGDADKDGVVTASDITNVIKTIKDYEKNNTGYQDIDNDGTVTASDITAVIQIMKVQYTYPGYELAE